MSIVSSQRRMLVDLASMDSEPETPETRYTTSAAFFPEWGRPWPLWGVGRRGFPELDEDLVGRLREWTRVWQEVLNPLTEVRWENPEVGRAWVREGYALAEEVQAAVAPRGIRIVPMHIDEYAPPDED